MTPLSPRLALAVFVAAIGWSSVLFRLAAAPPLLAAGMRVAIATVVLTFVFGRPALRALVSTPRSVAAAAAAGVLLCGHFAAWVPSLEYTTIAASTVLCSTQPLFAAGLEFLFFGERPSRRLLAGIGLGFTGILLVCSGDLSTSEGAFGTRALTGDLFALVGAVLAACYYLVGRGVRASIPLGAYLVWVNASAAAALLTLSALAGEPWFTGGYAHQPQWTGLTPAAFGYFALLAAVPHLLGHGAANYAVRHLPATVVNVATLGEPLVATALAVPFFGEVPGHVPLFATGGAVLLGGLGLVATDRRHQR